MSNVLISGFSDPAIDGLYNFRQLADVMARPGKIIELAKTLPLTGTHPATFATLLTLLDKKTSIYPAPQYGVTALNANIAFHTGCPIVAANIADFALLKGSQAYELNEFKVGSTLDPHQSCTLIIEVDDLNNQPTADDLALELTGAGIKTSQTVGIKNLHSCFINYLIERPDLFPCGLDFLLIANQQIMAIPRTTKVTIVEA